MAPVLTLGKDGWVLIGDDTEANMGDLETLDRIKQVLDEYGMKFELSPSLTGLNEIFDPGSIEYKVIEAFQSTQSAIFYGKKYVTKQEILENLNFFRSDDDDDSDDEGDDAGWSLDSLSQRGVIDSDLFEKKEESGSERKYILRDDIYKPFSEQFEPNKEEMLGEILRILFDKSHGYPLHIQCNTVKEKLQVFEKEMFSNAQASVFGMNLYDKWLDRQTEEDDTSSEYSEIGDDDLSSADGSSGEYASCWHCTGFCWGESPVIGLGAPKEGPE